MYKLKNDQLQTLLTIVEEEFGLGIKRAEFADVMLKLFDDIPGFETIPPTKANDIVNQLWSVYHGQASR